jgi:hypothetical protein
MNSLAGFTLPGPTLSKISDKKRPGPKTGSNTEQCLCLEDELRGEDHAADSTAELLRV